MSDDTNGANNNLQNLYEVTKTVRFNLLPVDYEPKEKLATEKFKNEIFDFVSNYKKVVEFFKSIVFTFDKGESHINPNIKIKLSWLKDFAKQEFFEQERDLVKTKFDKRLQKQVKTSTNVSLREAKFLTEKFENWISKNYLENKDEGGKNIKSGIVEELDKLNKSPLEKQGRNSDFAYWMHKINHRNNFTFIYSLFESINDKRGGENDEKITQTLEILKKCKTQIEKIQNYLRPSQSFGLEIEKTSLNYYTVNKRSKVYNRKGGLVSFERAIEIERERFTNDFNLEKYITNKYFAGLKKAKDNLKYNKITQPAFDEIEKEYNEKTDNLKNILDKCGFVFDNLKLEDCYQNLKIYKAEQKSALLQFLSKHKSFVNPFDSLKKEFGYETGFIDEHGENQKITKKIKLSLFDDVEKDKFNELLTVTNEIINQNNKLTKNQITEKKIKRGKDFFDTQSTKKDKYNKTIFVCPFQKYINFCELFKSVAMEYGRIKASIKGLEKEVVESQRLQSWSFLLEKDKKHYLVIVPKEKARKAYYGISNLNQDLKGNQSIWLIESLTLRALDKLCFGENSSFRENLEKDVSFMSDKKKYFITEKGKTRLKRIDEFPKKNGELYQNFLVVFYQDVLKLSVTQSQIQINLFVDKDYVYHPIFDSNIITLDKFRSELEKACYIKKEIKINQTEFEKIKQEFGAKVYQITSHDLEKSRNNPEEHTNIWKEFCNLRNGSGFITRINPEMKISYVEKKADSILDKSGKEVKRNRRKQAEFILSMTISQNNDRPKFDMSFRDKELIKAKIEEFNSELNNKINPNNIWYYGLDRGQEELLTLGIFKFPAKREKYETKNENWNKTVKGGEFEAWELKERNFLKTDEKGRIAYKNISYFIEDRSLFEKKTASCIDLTCAKLIGDKIVINGDLQTYINLKLEGAKRKIEKELVKLSLSKLKDNGDYSAKIEQRVKSNKKPERFALNITSVDGKTKDIDLYITSNVKNDKLRDLIECKSIKNDLDVYLKSLLEQLKNNPDQYFAKQISKINHLRDAICANAIGIITHLQKVKTGYICFEDLDEENKKKRFEEWNYNLGSRVELMALNKFKALGLVPPSYKMAMSMQSNKELNQLGIIKYVETSGTSSNCPNCGNRIDEKTKNLNKWGNHKFKCNIVTCSFNTYSQSEIDKAKIEKPNEDWNFLPDKKGLNFLDSSDDIATYNIAKRGLEFIKTQQVG